MPAHMDGAVAPAVPWATKVSQRKAPGAMSAIAFIVKLVRPRVGFIVTSELSGIVFSSIVRRAQGSGAGSQSCLRAQLPAQTLLLRREVRDQSEQYRRLRGCAIRLIVLFKEWFVRPVRAELGARH